jgi:hypothetical protein
MFWFDYDEETCDESRRKQLTTYMFLYGLMHRQF